MTSALEPVWIGVDVGGTKVLAGVVDEHGRVVRTARRATPGRRVDAVQVEDALVGAVLEVAAGSPIAGVGVAAAGFVDASGGRVMFAPHLPWQGEDVRDRLADRWGVPVTLDNDANGAAVAEWTYGAARGARSVVVVTMGTGIGGGIIIDDHLVRGANGMAGEFGHMQVVPGGQACECGGHGCWEQYSSGNALVRFARERMLRAAERAGGGDRRQPRPGDRTDGHRGGGGRRPGGPPGLRQRRRLARGRRRQPRRRVRPGGGRHRRRGVRRGRPAPRPGPDRAGAVARGRGPPARSRRWSPRSSAPRPDWWAPPSWPAGLSRGGSPGPARARAARGRAPRR